MSSTEEKRRCRTVPDRFPSANNQHMVLGRKGMTTPVRVQQSIRQLETKGLTHARIARELGVSRTTVVKYATRDYSPVPSTGELWIGNGVLDGFLEDESPFGEFLRTPVSEGGVEPLAVGPPHAVVGVMPRLPDRGVAVPVHELLPQQPVRRFDHGVAVGIALARQRSFDAEHVEQLVDPRVANSPHRSVRNTRTSASGKSRVANAPGTRPASRARPTEWPAMPLFARSASRHTYVQPPPTRT